MAVFLCNPKYGGCGRVSQRNAESLRQRGFCQCGDDHAVAINKDNIGNFPKLQKELLDALEQDEREAYYDGPKNSIFATDELPLFS